MLSGSTTFGNNSKAMEEVGVDISRGLVLHVGSLDLLEYDRIIAITRFVAKLLTKDFYIPQKPSSNLEYS